MAVASLALFLMKRMLKRKLIFSVFTVLPIIIFALGKFELRNIPMYIGLIVFFKVSMIAFLHMKSTDSQRKLFDGFLTTIGVRLNITASYIIAVFAFTVYQSGIYLALKNLIR